MRGTDGGYGRVVAGGVALVAIAQATKFACQLTSTIVLSRLLSPHDFGIFAMVMPLVAFVMMFQDFGLSQAVITVATLSRREESSFFYVNMALSIALALALAAGAPLVARFYGDAGVIGPTLALAGTVVLSGFATLQFALLVRHLRFTAMSVIDIVGAVAGLAASILVASVWPSVWALVASVVANMSCGLVCAWWATRWWPGRPARLADMKRLLAFGGGVAGSNFANFVARNGDNVLIGRYLGATPLGYYDRAYKLLLFPVQQVISPVGRIGIPILARLVDQPTRYLAAYNAALHQILLVTLPGMTALIVLADVVVPFVMGDKWLPVVPLFRWLGLAGIHMPLSATFSWLLVSQSRTSDLARWSVFAMVTSVIGFVVGLHWGVMGVAVVFATTDLFLRLPLFIVFVGRSGPVTEFDLGILVAPYVVGCGAAALAILALRDVVALPPPWLLLGGGALCYLMCWGVVAVLPGGRRTFAAVAAVLRDALPGRHRAMPAALAR